MANPAGLLIGAAIVAGVMLGFPALLLGAIAMLIARLLGIRVSIWWAELLLACLLVGALRHPAIANRTSPAELANADRVAGVVDSMPVARTGGDRMVLRVQRARIAGAWIPATGRVLISVNDHDPVTVDDQLEVVWEFTPIGRMTPSTRAFAQSQGTIGSATVWSVRVIAPNHSLRRYLVDVRRGIGRRIQAVVPGDAGALMTGIVTGDDSALATMTRSAFLATGTSHVTAVSGTNVAMLLALWEKPLRRRTRRRNLLVQAGIILSIWLYAATTGLEPSALRAATVATLIVLSGRFGRRADPMTVLAIASAGILLWQPDLTRSVGFWLSVLASAAIIGTFANNEDDSWRRKVNASITGLIAVQFATLPLIVLVFGYWPPISLVANLLLAPLMVIAFPLAFLASTVVYVPVLGSVTAIAPALVCDASLAIVQRLAPVVPPVSLKPMEPFGALLLACPCLVGLFILNVDFRRWWPRFEVLLGSRRVELGLVVVGFAVGGLLGVGIFRVFGG